MEVGKYKRLANDTLLFAISSFGSKILLFLLTPLYTNVLLTEEFGQADILTTTVNLIYPFLTLAVSEAVLRFTMDKETDNGAVFRVSLMFVFLSSAVLLLLNPLFSLINRSFSIYWYYFVAVYFLFNLHSCFTNFLKGIGNTKLFAIQGIIQTLTLVISNIMFLLVFKIGLKGYLISIIISYIIPIVIMLAFAHIYRFFIPFRFDKNTIIRMLKYSLPLIPGLIAWSINASIDKYMIIWFVGESENGIYSVAHKIPTLFTTVLAVFINAWQLSAISNFGKDDESDFYTNVYGALHIVSIFGAMCVIILSKPLSLLLFAKDYYFGWQYVPMLTISALFASFSGFLAAASRAAKKTIVLLVSVIVGAIINIVINYLMIPKYGALGASIATAVSFFIVWIIRIITIQRIVKVRINVLKTAISLLLLVASSLFITYNLKYEYIVWAISFVIIVCIYILDIHNLMKKGIAFVKKKKSNTAELSD